MRSNHLLLPAVSLLGTLLALAALASTATAKTSFFIAVCNNSCSNQGKVDQDLAREKGKPMACDDVVSSLPDNGRVLPQFVDKSSRLVPLGFAVNTQEIPEAQNSADPPIPNISQAQNCQSIMRLHGFLTRAQFECGFNSYSDKMIQKARDCAQSLTESETMKLLASGMKTFDREEKERGRARICEDVLREFPGIIRK